MKNLFLLLVLLLVPAYGQAAEYFAVDSGGGGSTCSIGSPCTLTGGLTKLASGDTLSLRGGTYSGDISSSVLTTSQSGSGSGTGTADGTSYAGATIIQAYQNEVVQINGQLALATSSGTYQYFIFRNLIINGGGVNMGGGGAAPGVVRYIKLENIESKNTNSGGQGMLIGGSGHIGHHIWITRANIHDYAGSAEYHYHCFYMEGANNVIEDSECHDWVGGFGIHNWSDSTSGDFRTPDSNIYRRNKFYRIGSSSAASATFAILLAVGNNNQAYNNLIYRNWGGIDMQASGNDVSNNTLYANGVGFGGGCCYPAIKHNGGSGGLIKNNLLIGNADNSIDTNGSSGPTLATNRTGDNAAATFLDPANNDLRLKLGAPAIDQGTNLSAIFTTDFDNSTRTVPWDVGAYEFGGGPVASCPGVNPALVASYAFEDSTNDSTGNNNTMNLGSGWTYTGGKYGRGVVSTGASGITVLDDDMLDMCGGFTYMGWINLPNTSGDYAFINKNPDSKSFLFAALLAYCAGATGVPVAGYTQSPVTTAACYGTPLTTGVFQHMAVTYDSTLPSGNVKLYINGSLATSADGTTLLDATTGTLQFCTSSFNETCPSGTIIDEIRIYNYARTAAQIVNDMNGAITVSVPTELKVSGITRRIGPGTTLRYGLKQ